MGVKFRDTDNGFKELKNSSKELNGKKVRVGYPTPSREGGIALVHEYGCVIPVTPKMRAWFASQGVFLRKNKKFIVIPERSFLRAGFDKHSKEVVDKVAKTVGYVLAGRMNTTQSLDLIGQLLASKIQDFAINLSTPPNAELTIEWKKSANPLIDKGNMVKAITWEVK